jgi:hypothetical protein
VIKGIVADSLTGEILDRASVKLLRSDNLSLVAETVSTVKGFFLQPVPKGHYQLIVSYIDYKPDTIAVYLNAATRIYNTGKIYLSKTPGTLAEVIVKAVNPPVYIKNDTVVYNTQAFQTRPYASIEDLLKKLPGITIDESGNIFFRNKKVDRIYIDGGEVWVNDLSTLTRNLRADMVAKVEAFSVADLKNTFVILNDEGSGAINLKLKKEKNKGLLGNGQLAYGTAGRYATGGSLNAIGDGRLIISTLSRMNVGDGYSVGRGKWSPSNSSTQQQYTDLQLNYSDNWSPSITASGTFFVAGRRINSAGQVHRQSFLEDSVLIETRMNESANNFHVSHFNCQIRFRLDSMNSLVYMPAAGIDKITSSSDESTLVEFGHLYATTYIQSNGLIKNQGSSKHSFLQNQLSYERKFKKKGRWVQGYFQWLRDDRARTNEMKFSLAFYNAAGVATSSQLIARQSFDETSARNFNSGLVYIEPITTSKGLRLSADFSSNENQTDQKSFIYNDSTQQYDQPDSVFTNRFNSRVIQQRWGIDLVSKDKPVHYEAGIEGMLTTVKNKNYTSKISTGQNQVNYIPHAIIGYKLNKINTINLSYRGNTMQPGIEQLQPVQDTRNPFLIITGNPGLKQQFTHQVSFQFTGFNPKTFQFFTAGLSASSTTRKIIPYSIYTRQGIQQLQFVNAPHPVYNLQGQVNYVFQFGEKKKNKIDISNTLVYGKDLSFVNAEENSLKQFSLQPTININYSLGNLTLEMNGGLQYSRLHYSLTPGSKTILLTQAYRAEMGYEFPWGLFFSTNTKFCITKNSVLPQQKSIEWNAFLSKRILKKQALETRLSGFNLLNANSNFIQTIGENFIETKRMQTLNRLFLVSLLYNFDSFGKLVKSP